MIVASGTVGIISQSPGFGCLDVGIFTDSEQAFLFVQPKTVAPMLAA